MLNCNAACSAALLTHQTSRHAAWQRSAGAALWPAHSRAAALAQPLIHCTAAIAAPAECMSACALFIAAAQHGTLPYLRCLPWLASGPPASQGVTLLPAAGVCALQPGNTIMHGTPECLACSARTQELLVWLHHGSPYAEVTQVEADWQAASGEFGREFEQLWTD